jgi:hypothetical protein
MPEDLLQELETSNSVAGTLEGIEDLVREAVRQAPHVSLAVAGMRGWALTFQKIWRRVVIEVARGQTTQMQAARPQLLSAFEKRLGLLKDTYALAEWLRMLGRAEIQAAAVLRPEIDGMDQLKASVFDRWHTAEDLEELAARDYPLTTGDLDRIGSQHRPPASYYQEEGKPF